MRIAEKGKTMAKAKAMAKAKVSEGDTVMVNLRGSYEKGVITEIKGRKCTVEVQTSEVFELEIDEFRSEDFLAVNASSS